MQGQSQRFPTNFQSDILFLLVGTNPLPNYVSARLLAPEGATIYLLHSTDTLRVAERLQRLLNRTHPNVSIIPREIDEADGDKIIAKIGEILRDISSAAKRVGLNYSGGTKSMAVHAYYTLHEKFPSGCFSYLDARTLSLVLDLGDQPVQWVRIGQGLPVTILDLLSLHGYRIRSVPRMEAMQPGLCQSIAEVHSTTDGFKQWRAWVSTLDQTPTLPSVEVFPALKPFLDACASMCNGAATENEIARILGFRAFKSCSNFFDGGWLEHHVLGAMMEVKDKLDIGSYGGNLVIEPTGQKDMSNLELDIAAMRGYQLFAISCIATEEAEKEADATKPGRAKEHLFEAFVRARQLGGDEASIGLVSCVKDAKRLEREIRRDWNEDRIMVLGQADLLSLPKRLTEWFERADQ